ncbi:MAG: response regulator transcription factor [Halobacteriales archaeon]
MGPTALLADDDETIRSILQHKLSAEGYELIVCEDGQEAREAFEQPDNLPDIAILDVMMPRLEGTQLLRMVRRGELDVDPQLPVMLLTSRGREDDVLDGLEYGADEYLTKPFSPNEVVVRLENILDR